MHPSIHLVHCMQGPLRCRPGWQAARQSPHQDLRQVTRIRPLRNSATIPVHATLASSSPPPFSPLPSQPSFPAPLPPLPPAPHGPRSLGQQFSWVMIGSHNLSKAAWGETVHQGETLRVRSYVSIGVTSELDIPALSFFPLPHSHLFSSSLSPRPPPFPGAVCTAGPGAGGGVPAVRAEGFQGGGGVGRGRGGGREARVASGSRAGCS